VATDIAGKSGRQIVAALVGGTTDAAALADLAQGRMREKLPALGLLESRPARWSRGAGGGVMTVRRVPVKQLGALPAIRAYLERLQLRERVDAVAPDRAPVRASVRAPVRASVRAVAQLTNGDVVVASVANRLTAPRPLCDVVEWAEDRALAEPFGIVPAALNDDRVGRCLDDSAAVRDRWRGDLTVPAIGAFGLATTTVRRDLTSVLVTAE
jgi:hypothetical protein